MAIPKYGKEIATLAGERLARNDTGDGGWVKPISGHIHCETRSGGSAARRRVSGVRHDGYRPAPRCPFT